MAEHNDFLAKFGTNYHHEKMLNNSDGRLSLAKHADQPMLSKVADHLGKTYKKDSDPFPFDDSRDIQSARHVVMRGNQANKDSVFNTYLPDRHDDIAGVIAKHGSSEQKTLLSNHQSHRVRAEVAEHGRDSDREKLMKDDHVNVRRSVAEAPSLSLAHAKILANDEDHTTALSAARNINHRAPHLSDKELRDLQNHEHSTVRNIATRTLNDNKKLDDFMDSIKDDDLLKQK